VSVPHAVVTLKIDKKKKLEQSGPLLITHWGLSGPAVLKLSAWGARILGEHNYQMPITVNWLPSENTETLRQKLQTFKAENPKKKIITFSPVDLPKRLWQSFVQYANIQADQNWADLSKKQLNILIQEITQGSYQIQGKGVFKEEFVTCGGVSLKEVNFKTMECRVCPHLYFAGEVLDIDGVTGGFNFQSAWTTSWIAGNACGS
jgi:predicted Rossmann fold flavoprotein